MIHEIRTIEDVKAWFKQLVVQEDLNFHPDTPFEDYINGETQEPTYTKVEAEFRDGLMSAAFEVCEAANVDIYNLSMEIYLIESGMGKYFPLPSSIKK